MKNPSTAIILAGGLGTRLRAVVNDLPKCMALVNEKPFLEFILQYLEKQGVKKVILSVGYKKEAIINYFGSKWKSLELDYSIEDEPLGTGGAIKKAVNIIAESSFYVLNGDTLFNVDLMALAAMLASHKATSVLALRKLDDVNRYGSVECDNDYKITAFVEKGKREGSGLINGGIYCIDRNLFQKRQLPEKFSIEKDYFQKYLNELHLYGLESSAYFIDIGIPEDYNRVQHELKY